MALTPERLTRIFDHAREELGDDVPQQLVAHSGDETALEVDDSNVFCFPDSDLHGGILPCRARIRW
jgi:hypothetical protein